MDKKNFKIKKSLTELIESELSNFKTQAKEFKVLESSILITGDNKKAIIKSIMTGRRQQPFESIAYVDEEDSVSLIVLSSKNKKAHDESMPIFESMIKSYSFFTSNVKIEK